MEKNERRYLQIITAYWEEAPGDIDKTLDLFYSLSEKNQEECKAWIGNLIYTPSDKAQVTNFFNSL